MEEKKELTREEEADEIVKRLATQPPNPKDELQEYFKKIIIPMVRNLEPSLIAEQIVGIQPMLGNYKEIFKDKNKDKE